MLAPWMPRRIPPFAHGIRQSQTKASSAPAGLFFVAESLLSWRMVRVHHTMKLAAERKFPVRVDIPVPAAGFGNRLNEMEAWCRTNFHANQWAHHGHSEKEPGQIPQYYARFYFMR
jgi:hypothetical protein